MDLSDRIRRYLAAVPSAVSGANGHSQTFSVACALVNGFALDAESALAYLREYSRLCDPPWSEKELRHKITSAETTNHAKPRGHLLGGAAVKPETPPGGREAPRRKIALGIKPDEVKGRTLPKPIEDGARLLLETVYDPVESVRLVVGEFNEHGKDVPKNRGVVLTAREWLDRMEKKGGPNGLFKSTGKQPGIFIGMNPVRPRGAADSEVAAYRFALIEFDDVPLEAQWELIETSNLPCAAVIASGGKSVHAWVRVNAKDRAEYDERVEILRETFEAYGVDRKNRNPARLSRLPGCARGDRRQELLAVGIGAESFTAWLAEREVDEGMKPLRVSELLAYRSDNDPRTLIGGRWLNRGGSILFIGQSGIGKSSFATQAAITWALGRPLFGMTPVKPLRQLIVQAENDEGDIAEMVQGVTAALGIDELSEEVERLDEMLHVTTDATHIGEEFVRNLQREIDRCAPDIVWIDPLLAFVGDDISQQRVCGRFLREWLAPVIRDVGLIMMHHTNKPPADSKSKKDWSDLDYAYAGTGSAELTNWARGAAVLRQAPGEAGENAFLLHLTKRGRRAGAVDLDGQPTTRIWLRQGDHGICWVQREEPDPPEPKGRPKSRRARLKKAGGGSDAAEGGKTPPAASEAQESAPQPGRPSKWDAVLANPRQFAARIASAGEWVSERTLAERLARAGGPSSSRYWSRGNAGARGAWLAEFEHDPTRDKWRLKGAKEEATLNLDGDA